MADLNELKELVEKKKREESQKMGNEKTGKFSFKPIEKKDAVKKEDGGASAPASNSPGFFSKLFAKKEAEKKSNAPIENIFGNKNASPASPAPGNAPSLSQADLLKQIIFRKTQRFKELTKREPNAHEINLISESALKELQSQNQKMVFVQKQAPDQLMQKLSSAPASTTANATETNAIPIPTEKKVSTAIPSTAFSKAAAARTQNYPYQLPLDEPMEKAPTPIPKKAMPPITHQPNAFQELTGYTPTKKTPPTDFNSANQPTAAMPPTPISAYSTAGNKASYIPRRYRRFIRQELQARGLDEASSEAMEMAEEISKQLDEAERKGIPAEQVNLRNIKREKKLEVREQAQELFEQVRKENYRAETRERSDHSHTTGGTREQREHSYSPDATAGHGESELDLITEDLLKQLPSEEHERRERNAAQLTPGQPTAPAEKRGWFRKPENKTESSASNIPTNPFAPTPTSTPQPNRAAPPSNASNAPAPTGPNAFNLKPTDLFGEQKKQAKSKQDEGLEDDFKPVDLSSDNGEKVSGQDLFGDTDLKELENLDESEEGKCENCHQPVLQNIYCSNCGQAFCDQCGKDKRMENGKTKIKCPKCGTENTV